MIVNDKMIEAASNVLCDYYRVEVPNEFMKSLLEENQDLAMEAKCGGIRDTCQRELLIDCVLNKLGVRSWPTYGEGELVYSNFLKAIEISLRNIGGKLTDI